jgi:hypothetical protein
MPSSEIWLRFERVLHGLRFLSNLFAQVTGWLLFIMGVINLTMGMARGSDIRKLRAQFKPKAPPAAVPTAGANARMVIFPVLSQKVLIKRPQAWAQLKGVCLPVHFVDQLEWACQEPWAKRTLVRSLIVSRSFRVNCFLISG